MSYLYCAWCAGALVLCSLECFRVLQSTGYKPQRGYVKIVLSPYMLCLVLLCVFSALWKTFFTIKWIICTVYTLFGIVAALIKRKSPLKFTKRICRLLLAEYLITFAATTYLLYVWVLFVPLFVIASWALCLPIDAIIAKKYLNRAHKKLLSSDITVIGITGSYGKTSTKDMLSALLSNSVAPCGSCNTPLGIAKFINQIDLVNYRYLILEFGARKRGDIAELCKLFPPKYGIITGICPQHLSTFKTLENIATTKCELIQSLPQDGICILADVSVSDFASVGVCKKLIKSDVKVTQEKVAPSGTDFFVTYGKQRSAVHLPQISNYASHTFKVCATMCVRLGQSFSQTIDNASKITQTPHRMQVMHNGRFYIIDDSYNGSLSGVEACADTLRRLSGRKIAISQGLVECGKQRKRLNARCGEVLGSACDIVIAVGKNSRQIALGARSYCSALTAKNLNQAVKTAQIYLENNCFLLFQNDLPDVANL